MSTALVSDLHLGTLFETDVLRARGPARERLLAELEGADQIVLLGDTLELRQAPLAEALESARDFLGELGERLAGRRIVVVPGNHDHQLADPLLERQRMDPSSAGLGLEQLLPPEGSGPLAWVAERLAGGGAGARAEVVLAYPGLWIRPDVYATHGHYLDCHLTVPRIERLAVAAVEKLLGSPPVGARSPDDYERLLAPLYALAFHLAQGASAKRSLAATDLSARIWRRLDTSEGPDPLGLLLGRVALPAAIGALNLAGMGPFSARLTGDELRRAGLAGMEQVVSGLGIEADHVIFGHTHRPGPLDGERGFELPGGRAFTNTGSWLHNPAFDAAAGDRPNPYRPGVVVHLPDSGPPELRCVLDDVALPSPG